MTAAGGQCDNRAQAPESKRWGHCNLDPLRDLGPDSLRPNIPEIHTIRLVEVEVIWEGPPLCIEILKGEDLFHTAAIGAFSCPIPRTGQISRAVFAVQFSDSPHITIIQLSLSDPPALPEGSDTQFLKRWLTQTGFCA